MADFTFHHGAMSVPDLEEAIAWYGRVLGFEEEKRFFIPPARAYVAMMRKGALRVELFAPEEGNPLPPDRSIPQADIRTHGNKHVAWQVADLDSFMAEMEAKGVPIVFKVRENFGAGCFIHDCAGNLIEFVTESNP
jgi:catechol 2,3-dioxygenase-like lactoylglutathione lyase family enzyme